MLSHPRTQSVFLSVQQNYAWQHILPALTAVLCAALQWRDLHVYSNDLPTIQDLLLSSLALNGVPLELVSFTSNSNLVKLELVDLPSRYLRHFLSPSSLSNVHLLDASQHSIFAALVDLKLHLPFNKAVEYMCFYPYFAHVTSVQLYTDCQQARLVSSLYRVLPSVVSLDLSGCVPEAVVALTVRVPSSANVVPPWSTIKPEVDILLQYHKLTGSGIVRSIERVLWPPTSPAFYHNSVFY
ncbi:hypothetical protein B0H14DRAFT_2633023 [Mycena olivaceomarginata]|nr:hypothetical protein B0H14DRAFT_2633023 [Mycena olivaceomarginata]